MKRILCVIGMHRSGTSATAGVLSKLGVDFGSDLMPPSQANPKGYFESNQVVRIHNRLLNQLGSNWKDTVRLPEDWEGRRSTYAALQSLHLWWERNRFDEVDLAGVKDPRMCRFLPLWQRFAKERELELLPVIVTRCPHAVVQSLVAREGWTPKTAKALLNYTAGCVEEWAALPRAVSISFEDLMRDHLTTIDRIDDEVDLPTDDSYSWEGVFDFLDKDLVHHG